MQAERRAPLCDLDPTRAIDRATIENPHVFYTELRENRPLSRVGDSGFHLVANWSLIEEALRREADFSANLTGVMIRDAAGKPACFEIGGSGANDVIATADEPDHGVHRALLSPGMTHSRIDALEDRIRGWTRDALRPLVAEGGGDFAPLTEIVPARAVGCLLGLPAEDTDSFRKWAMMGGDMLAGNASHETLVRLGTETGKMAEYLGQHFDRAMAQPDFDPGAPLLHALANGVQSRKIERAQAVGIAIVLFGAGGESTAALLGASLRLLAENREIQTRLRADPALIPRFVEEVVRLEPPFKFHYRVVRRDCEFGGYDLQRGHRLMLLWAAANRDPKVIEEPDQLRLDRRFPKKHMSFGRGAHFCIGAALARLEARVMLEELLHQTKSVTLGEGDALAYAQSIFIRRLERVRLAL